MDHKRSGTTINNNGMQAQKSLLKNKSAKNTKQSDEYNKIKKKL